MLFFFSYIYFLRFLIASTLLNSFLLSLLLAIFSSSIHLYAQSELNPHLKKAERLFFEKQYADAEPFYYELLQNSIESNSLQLQLKMRLATCLIEEKFPQEALSLLSSIETSDFCNQTLYLLSRAHSHLESQTQALQALLQCLPTNRTSEENCILIDKGKLLWQLGDFESAQLAFQSITWRLDNPTPYRLAQLQLAKVFIAQGQLEDAFQTLQKLVDFLPSEDPLNIVRTYLIGWIQQSRNENGQAAAHFESLLSKALPDNASRCLILDSTIVAYLRHCLLDEFQKVNLKELFSKVEKLLAQLISKAPNERSYLLLSDFFFIKARCLEDESSYAKAVAVLDEKKFVYSPEGFRQALLKKAAAAPFYQERSRLYELLSNDQSFPPSFKAKIAFLKGLNDFDEWSSIQIKKKITLEQNELSNEILEKAAQSFIQALDEKGGISSSLSALAAKYLSISLSELSEVENLQKAFETIEQLLSSNRVLSFFEQREELYCLYAWTALRLDDEKSLKKAKLAMKKNLQHEIVDPFWRGRILKFDGLLSLQLFDWQEVDRIFTKILKDDALRTLHGDALFWLAKSAESQQNNQLKLKLLEQIYSKHTQSPYAAPAYFNFYSYRDYMHGTKKAIKHLQKMPQLFPDHPLTISAYFLMGLYHKKDHLSETGKILRRKSWTSAIDAFQGAESTFDILFKKNLIPFSELKLYMQLRYRAELEKAEANLAIAQHSTAGKKQIYLDYAETVFNDLIAVFTSSETMEKKLFLYPQDPYPKILADAYFQLAKTLEEKKEWDKAVAILDKSLELSFKVNRVQGIEIMRTWRAKGKLAQHKGKIAEALEYFMNAEKSVPDLECLSPHEKLDLWIEQSLSYKGLNQLDLAMRLLSRVINEDAISPLRIKAMVLRSEIYELQGRSELALKQLEAAARKGGEWAQKAKEKLEKDYGYPFAPPSSNR